MRAVGRRFRGQTARVHLVGGGCLVHEGIKAATVDIDVDVRETPAADHEKLMTALQETKRELQMSIEEASPADFIPLPRGARERARFLARHGRVDFFLYDPYSMALAKIDRGQERDFEDVLAMLHAELIAWDQLEERFAEILPRVGVESLRGDPERFARHFEALRRRREAP